MKRKTFAVLVLLFVSILVPTSSLALEWEYAPVGSTNGSVTGRFTNNYISGSWITYDLTLERGSVSQYWMYLRRSIVRPLMISSGDIFVTGSATIWTPGGWNHDWWTGGMMLAPGMTTTIDINQQVYIYSAWNEYDEAEVWYHQHIWDVNTEDQGPPGTIGFVAIRDSIRRDKISFDQQDAPYVSAKADLTFSINKKFTHSYSSPTNDYGAYSIYTKGADSIYIFETTLPVTFARNKTKVLELDGISLYKAKNHASDQVIVMNLSTREVPIYLITSPGADINTIFNLSAELFNKSAMQSFQIALNNLLLD